jgi:hypothetical protein
VEVQVVRFVGQRKGLQNFGTGVSHNNRNLARSGNYGYQKVEWESDANLVPIRVLYPPDLFFNKQDSDPILKMK